MGNHKYIKSPERMWELFLLYRDGIKATPIMVHDFVGKDGDSVERKKERPLTMEGFENYLFRENIISDVSDYFENKNDSYRDFLPICRAIKRTIRQDQIEGGMSGIYNPSITQRLNNLKEQTDNKIEHSGIINANFGTVIQPAPKPSDDTQ